MKQAYLIFVAIGAVVISNMVSEQSTRCLSKFPQQICESISLWPVERKKCSHEHEWKLYSKFQALPSFWTWPSTFTSHWAVTSCWNRYQFHPISTLFHSASPGALGGRNGRNGRDGRRPARVRQVIEAPLSLPPSRLRMSVGPWVCARASMGHLHSQHLGTSKFKVVIRSIKRQTSILSYPVPSLMTFETSGSWRLFGIFDPPAFLVKSGLVVDVLSVVCFCLYGLSWSSCCRCCSCCSCCWCCSGCCCCCCCCCCCFVWCFWPCCWQWSFFFWYWGYKMVRLSVHTCYWCWWRCWCWDWCGAGGGRAAHVRPRKSRRDGLTLINILCYSHHSEVHFPVFWACGCNPTCLGHSLQLLQRFLQLLQPARCFRCVLHPHAQKKSDLAYVGSEKAEAWLHRSKTYIAVPSYCIAQRREAATNTNKT